MLKLTAMAQIICIANQKGGVGKTTTAVNLSAALAVSEKRTLLVDCDPQANATTGVGLDKSLLSQTLYHGLIGDAGADAVIVDSPIESLKVMPSRVELIGFDIEMMDRPRREHALQRLLGSVKADFEYIVIE
jgi:chromosome partitioning protein